MLITFLTYVQERWQSTDGFFLLCFVFGFPPQSEIAQCYTSIMCSIWFSVHEELIQMFGFIQVLRNEMPTFHWPKRIWIIRKYGATGFSFILSWEKKNKPLKSSPNTNLTYRQASCNLLLFTRHITLTFNGFSPKMWSIKTMQTNCFLGFKFDLHTCCKNNNKNKKLT